jgi:hypothetical protein
VDLNPLDLVNYTANEEISVFSAIMIGHLGGQLSPHVLEQVSRNSTRFERSDCVSSAWLTPTKRWPLSVIML